MGVRVMTPPNPQFLYYLKGMLAQLDHVLESQAELDYYADRCISWRMLLELKYIAQNILREFPDEPRVKT
jgi:hypothetical protein